MRPLINEQDPETKQKVISIVENAVKEPNFCDMSNRAYSSAMRYWDEYRKAEEDRIDKNPGM